MDTNATAFVRAATLTFAPCKGEIHRVQIEDLCDGYISLSNAEGLREKSGSWYLFPHTAFSLTIFTGACHAPVIHTKGKIYHRKSRCIPTLSRYSCRAFSRSSSVGAVLYFVYESRLIIASSLSSNPILISGKTSSISTNDTLKVRRTVPRKSVCFHSINPSFPSRPQQRNVYEFCNLAMFISANYI